MLLPATEVVLTVVYKEGAVGLPIVTIPSENASIIGKPDISFTLNKDPVKLSVIENNSPEEP